MTAKEIVDFKKKYKDQWVARDGGGDVVDHDKNLGSLIKRLKCVSKELVFEKVLPPDVALAPLVR